MKRRFPFLIFIIAAAAVAPLAAQDVQPTPKPWPAAAATETAIPPAPELQEARKFLGEGQWRPARTRISAFLRNNKKSSEAWILLARTFYEQGRHKKTLGRLKRALRLNPHNAEAYFWKGRTYEAMGKPDEASNEYQAAFRADPNMTSARDAWQKLKDVASQKSEPATEGIQ